VDIRDHGNVIDWFPGDHPPMSHIIAHGSASLGNTAWGCASCHLPNGRGRPENAPVSGLPVSYFIRQIEDFRNGLRATVDPRKPNTPTMIALAKAMTDDEVKSAAEYFGAMPWTPWTRVVETDLVPKTRIAGNLFLVTKEAKTEPIAGRIIEVPADEEQSEGLRNPRSGFIAYVPVGSVKRGENLVTMGGMSVVDGRIVPGKTIACGTCHGPDLKGLADVPGIAGRSPSYLVRQIYDLQRGTRKGASAPLMQPVVANLTGEDMVAIAAYVTSLVPPPAPPPGEALPTAAK
jgi:cytochrome c553